MDLSAHRIPCNCQNAKRIEAELQRLWARDHARGHRYTEQCPVCVKFGPSTPRGP